MSILSDHEFWATVEAHAPVWRGALYRRAGEMEEPDVLLNNVRWRLWLAQQRGKFICSRQVIAYGNMAISSVATDAWRRRDKALSLETLTHEHNGADLPWQVAGDSDTPRAAEQTDWRRAFWATLLPLMPAADERIAVGTLAVGISPREVAEMWPGLFPDAKLVHTLRKRFMYRVQSSGETLSALRELWAMA